MKVIVMKDAQKPDHMSLNTLIGRLKEGRFVIPDFQREFEWRPWDINSLIRSIFLDYYIGSLLLWRGKRKTLRHCHARSCMDSTIKLGNISGITARVILSILYWMASNV